MGRLVDLTGQKFGRLTVIKRAGTSKRNQLTWLCKCDCGNINTFVGNNLKTGNTKSCGCYANDVKFTSDYFNIQKRLEKRINKTSYCWIWTGSLNECGYGKIWYKGKNRFAHRLIYTLFKGEIGDGLVICHTCDNRKCVNPDHLWAGTSQENCRDMVIKERQARGENHSKAILSEADVLYIRSRKKYFGLQKELSEMFKIHNSVISAIINRKIWRHI